MLHARVSQDSMWQKILKSTDTWKFWLAKPHGYVWGNKLHYLRTISSGVSSKMQTLCCADVFHVDVACMHVCCAVRSTTYDLKSTPSEVKVVPSDSDWSRS